MHAGSFRTIGKLASFAVLALTVQVLMAQTQPLGIFEGHQDVGTVLHAGQVEYDGAAHTYTVSGSGENMWFSIDDFQFAWKKVSGDVALTADIAFLGVGGNPHRKAVLMIRQTLEGKSTSVDLAVHGSGLTSLQYRGQTGADTHEVESNVTAPKTVRLEKRGEFIYAFVAGKDGKLQPAGAATKLAFSGPFYVGIGVCAHDKDAVEKAVFSNVSLEELQPGSGKTILVSALETISIDSTDRHVEYVAPAHFEAPNWSPDGLFFVFNQDGSIYRLDLGGSKPTQITPPPPAGSADQFNAAQLNSIIANQQQVNSNSGANIDTVAAIQSNAAGLAVNKGELELRPQLTAGRSSLCWHEACPNRLPAVRNA